MHPCFVYIHYYFVNVRSGVFVHNAYIQSTATLCTKINNLFINNITQNLKKIFIFLSKIKLSRDLKIVQFWIVMQKVAIRIGKPLTFSINIAMHWKSKKKHRISVLYVIWSLSFFYFRSLLFRIFFFFENIVLLVFVLEAS